MALVKIGKSSLSRLCAATILGGIAEPALAQDAAEPAAGDIVVTAQRKQQSVQDVPIAITALSGDALDRQNIRGIDDVFARVANVSFVSNGSRDRKELTIRGISNLLEPYQTSSHPATYGFYIDDFNVVTATSNPEIADLERIEVLRGPQGTYYGRNAIAGAVNVTTRKPVDRWEGEVGLGYSSFDTKRASAVLNVPVVPGLLALRGSGVIETSDGNIKNINPIGGGNSTNYKSGRIIARLTPAPGIVSDTSFSYTREVNAMRAGVPTGFLTATWYGIYYGGTGAADPDGVGFYPANRDRVNFNTPQTVGTKYWYATNKTSFDLGPVTLTSVGGYLKNTVKQLGDVDGSGYDIFNEDTIVHRKSWSEELRLQSNGGGRFEWSVGANTGKDTGRMFQSTTFGSFGLFGQPDGFPVSVVDSSTSARYYAAFAQATFHIDDRLSVTAEGRYSHEKLGQRFVRYSFNALTDDTDRTKSFDDFSPKATVTYKASPDFMAYATVSHGFKSGGLQAAQANLADYYKPEKLWNYEGGIKFQAFDRRLRGDLSVFYMDWKGVQQAVRFIYLNNGVLVSVDGTDNAGSAESYGVDGSLDFQVTDHLLIDGRVGYNRARYTDFPDALVDNVTLNLKGKPLVAAPKWTIGADAEYRHPVVDELEGFARVEWQYRSSTYSNTFAYVYERYPFISPGYHNVNLRLGLEDKRKRIVFYVENLFDANYYSNVYEKAFYSGVQVEPSYRRFGVLGSYKF